MVTTATSKNSRLLVELDCLLDTRLAVLTMMGDAALAKAFNEDYYYRQSDTFKEVDYDDFKMRYKNRDKSVLKHALTTPISKFIKEFVLSTMSNVNNSPFHLKPSILINMYPYVLTEQEQNIIVHSVKQLTNGLCDIECVSLSHEKLTPLYLKLNLSIAVIYEYDAWLEVHAVSKAWEKTTAPDVSVVCPMIAMIKQTRPNQKFAQAFEQLSAQAAPFVDLKFLPIEHFSLILKPEDFIKANKELFEEKDKP